MNLLPLLVLIPLAGAFLSFLLPRYEKVISLTVIILLSVLTLFLGNIVFYDGPIKLVAGGWPIPLGIGLYADGLTILMLALSSIVALAVSIYALFYFDDHKQSSNNLEKSNSWWPIWMLLLSALNALFIASDAFNLYVTLELMGLSAVALIALEKKAIAAALRYLFVGLLGSMFYLFGIGLLYALYGTVDIIELSLKMQNTPTTMVSMVLITGGLLLKTALFPVHFWLPPAHANAPAPVSAVLSALVVKAAFYTLLRLWLGPFELLVSDSVVQFLGILGAGAIIWGSLQALFAQRLKLVIAYSTIAQLGYLFLFFPFYQIEHAKTIAWYGVIWMALSHGLAKAGLFLAAGNVLHAYGHDNIQGLKGSSQYLPITIFAVGIACINLMGLPPSGAFLGKWLLLNAAFVSGQWWWAVILLLGGVLAAAYSFRILLFAFQNDDNRISIHKPHGLMQWSALVLTIGAILLGMFSEQLLNLLSSGAKFGALNLAEILR